jgi:hypothetical protein
MMQFLKIIIVSVSLILLCLYGLCLAGEFIDWEPFKVELLLKPAMPMIAQPGESYTSNISLNNGLRDLAESNIVDEENVNSYTAETMRLSISRLI